MIRKPISKKKRFDIFKRDKFTCQYCGSFPPNSILHVDHITPVKLGGDNSADNLITSCSFCNSGKAAASLDEIPESLKNKAAKIKESELQIAGYNEILTAKRHRIDSQSWEICNMYLDSCALSLDSIRKDYFRSIKNFIERGGYHLTYDAMEIACSKPLTGNKLFRYFCGVCWRKITESEHGSL
jgi:DNA-directed RNA polymerase subunit RPC12/RpoP